MADFSNFSFKHLPPNNYSGVTIHVNNPSVNTAPNAFSINPFQQNNDPNIGTHNGFLPNWDNSRCYTHNGFAPIPQDMNPCCYTHNGFAPTYNNTDLITKAGALIKEYQNKQEKAQQFEYPAEYYINNYNYPQNQITKTEQVKLEEENTNTSKEIITKLDEILTEQKKLEKTGKQKRIIALTNEYIMSLENYLNNPNNEIRVMAAKEILTRLDEDKSRYNDAALNALLNKMLQDPSKLVRIAAMSAFSSKLASGNEYTVKLLQDIQNNPNSNKDDVVQAANILLMMSGETEIIYEPVKAKDDKSSTKDDVNQQQIQQLREQLQKYKEKQIEQELAQQMKS